MKCPNCKSNNGHRPHSYSWFGALKARVEKKRIPIWICDDCHTITFDPPMEDIFSLEKREEDERR